MKVVIAPDSYKGGPTTGEVAAAIAEGWRAVRPADDVVCVPLADGGEGTLDVLAAGVAGARRRPVAATTGPDGLPVDAEYLLLDDGTAIVELASSSGLPLMARLDPVNATSRGVGEVIAAALRDGATKVVLGVGGSASTDGGAGALAALGARFLDVDGNELPDGGGALATLAGVDLSGLTPAPARGMEILADVDTVLFGPRGAASVFGPQKGADEAQIAQLDRGLRQLAAHLGGDPSLPGTGAAGGVAYGFAAVWQARVRPGCKAIAAQLDLAGRLADADLVITGEGRLDATTQEGKVVSVVLDLAATTGTRVAVVAGAVETPTTLPASVTIISLSDLAGSAERSLSTPERFLREAGARLATSHGADA